MWEVPFRGLHLWGAGAKESTKGVVLHVPLAEGQGADRAWLYVSRESAEGMGLEVICAKECCRERIVLTTLPAPRKEAA
jgi:hypothetical protein